MELLTEIVRLATALVLLAVALLKLRAMSKADGLSVREDEKGRDTE